MNQLYKFHNNTIRQQIKKDLINRHKLKLLLHNKTYNSKIQYINNINRNKLLLQQKLKQHTKKKPNKSQQKNRKVRTKKRQFKKINIYKKIKKQQLSIQDLTHEINKLNIINSLYMNIK